ncbi:MAG: amidase [Ardenticatenaceae bacterium]|nr:amidase [Ardenticatenaceae bacterium]
MAGWQIRDLITRKEVSPLEVARHFLDRIQELDSKLHCFLAIAPGAALEQAQRAQDAVLRQEPLGPLHGVPVSVKDMFWVKGMPATAGSLVYRDFMPDEDSVHAERLRKAGALILGKTNTPEFGLSGRTANRLGPECVNPWDLKRTSGGSSGGAAASVAAGMTPLAIGSDGGGSIRLPAAFCGVFGLHPSNGRVPRQGGFGGTLIFSGVGPITRDIRDAALLFQVLAGPDDRDPTCRRETPPDYLASLEEGVKGLAIAWTPDNGHITGSDAKVVESAHQAACRLGEWGAQVEEPDLKLDDPSEAMGVITRADNYAFLGRILYDDPGTRGLLAPYSRIRYAGGREVTGAEYAMALKVRYQFIAQLDRSFEQYDLLASPTVGYLAPCMEDWPEMGMPPSLVAFTEMVNFSGYAAASVPCGFVQGLPVGLHLIARPNQEALLFRAARVLEQAQPWSPQHPTWA